MNAGSDPAKQAIRESVWQALIENKAARFPGARGRIPNFVGSERAASQLAALPQWQAAEALKCNPDSPQLAVRKLALEQGKLVYMAAPKLAAEKPFIELDPERLTVKPHHAASIKGAFAYGRPVGLDEMEPIDLLVCGSVAVSAEGSRLGKGGGYSDLEFGLAVEAGLITGATTIVTTVHPLQVIDGGIPMTVHDIPLQFFATPDGLVECEGRFDRPRGVYWDRLPDEKIDEIPVLIELRKMRGATTA